MSRMSRNQSDFKEGVGLLDFLGINPETCWGASVINVDGEPVSPHLQDGDLAFLDSKLSPCEGDIVLVSVHNGYAFRPYHPSEEFIAVLTHVIHPMKAIAPSPNAPPLSFEVGRKEAHEKRRSS